MILLYPVCCSAIPPLPVFITPCLFVLWPVARYLAISTIVIFLSCGCVRHLILQYLFSSFPLDQTT